MAAAFGNMDYLEQNNSDLLQRHSEENVLTAQVSVLPHTLRYNLRHVIQDRLSKTLRGRCTEKDGFVLRMKRIIEPIEGGLLDKRTGAVHYDVNYVAQTLNPHVGEVVEAVVSRVFQIGVFADLGPLNIFIPANRIPDGYEFQTLPTAHYTLPGDVSAEKTIRIGSELHVRIEKIAMLDDNFLPSNSTSTVLKAMGEICGVQSSLRTQQRQAAQQPPPSYADVARQ